MSYGKMSKLKLSLDLTTRQDIKRYLSVIYAGIVETFSSSICWNTSSKNAKSILRSEGDSKKGGKKENIAKTSVLFD